MEVSAWISSNLSNFIYDVLNLPLKKWIFYTTNYAIYLRESWHISRSHVLPGQQLALHSPLHYISAEIHYHSFPYLLFSFFFPPFSIFLSFIPFFFLSLSHYYLLILKWEIQTLLCIQTQSYIKTHDYTNFNIPVCRLKQAKKDREYKGGMEKWTSWPAVKIFNVYVPEIHYIHKDYTFFLKCHK